MYQALDGRLTRGDTTMGELLFGQPKGGRGRLIEVTLDRVLIDHCFLQLFRDFDYLPRNGGWPFNRWPLNGGAALLSIHFVIVFFLLPGLFFRRRKSTMRRFAKKRYVKQSLTRGYCWTKIGWTHPGKASSRRDTHLLCLSDQPEFPSIR